MKLEHESTYYDILEITSDASQQEIRSAYLKAKLTYSKDNPVLYSLLSTEDREETLKKIEEAYSTLSDIEKRKRYDHSHGVIQVVDDVPSSKGVGSSYEDTEENLLISPPTDFAFSESTPDVPPYPPPLEGVSSQSSHHSKNEPSHLSSHHTSHTSSHPFDHTPSNASKSAHQVDRTDRGHGGFHEKAFSPAAISPPPMSPAALAEIQLREAIAQEMDWKGSFLRKVRETHQISLEEMADATKISKSFITAIEEENFVKLPAPVFTRGFVTQIARILKLPQEKVAPAFMSRYNAARNLNPK